MRHGGVLVRALVDVVVEMNAQDLVREIEWTCLVESCDGRI